MREEGRGAGRYKVVHAAFNIETRTYPRMYSRKRTMDGGGEEEQKRKGGLASGEWRKMDTGPASRSETFRISGG